MSILVSGQPLTEWTQLTDNTATVIFTATKRTTITSIIATETNGGTQTLSIYVTKAAGDRYLRRERAATARETAVFDQVFTLDNGDVLKATSSSNSRYFDIMVTYLAPDALASR
jgi:hypothetical protein